MALHGDYEFTAIEFTGSRSNYVSLSMEPTDDRAQRYFQNIWAKMSAIVVNFHEQCGDGQCPAWTSWQVYKWSKELVPGMEGYVAWNGALMAGFMNLRFPFESQREQGKPIAYLEHLAAFPGCQPTRIWNRRVGRVGQALLAYAVYQSVLRGSDGIVGFHAADESAREWYEGLNARYDNKLVQGPMEQIAGFYERSSALPYYETMREGSLMLLEQYRHG